MPGQLKLLSGEIPEATMVEDSDALPEEPSSPNEVLGLDSGSGDIKINASSANQHEKVMPSPSMVS